MRIKATDVTPKRQDLAAGKLGNDYYALHTDFGFLKIVFTNGVLSLLTQHSVDQYYVVLRFSRVEIELMELDPGYGLPAPTAIYRATETNEDPLGNGKPLFYVHFGSQDIIGFYTDSISIDRYEEIPADLRDDVVRF